MADPVAATEPAVARLREGYSQALTALLAARGLQLQPVADDAQIPGSYWGDSEAGLIGNTLFARADTPVHSVLHEASHWLCMDAERRAKLHTDARSDELEEHAVCYLQGLLATQLPGYSQTQLFADMDAWGYSFVLGSARAFFERDSADARQWLAARGLMS